MLLVALTTLPSIATRELMPTDEPRFALVARQMVEDPAPVVPHLGYDAVTREGEPYADKPPVFFWLVSLFSFVTGGVNEISARLPSLLSAVAVVLMTWRMGRLLFDDATGVLGAALLATTSQFFLRAGWCSIDMTLTAFTTAATWCWLAAVRTPPRASPLEDGSRGALLAGLGGFFAAAATLSKGPVGLIFPLAFLVADRIVAWYTTSTDESAVRKGPTHANARAKDGASTPARGLSSRAPDLGDANARPRPHLRAIAFAALAFFVPVGAWVASIGAIAGWSYIVEILFKQNVTRYVAAWNNIAPWYYYFGRLPVGLLPWLLLLPGAVLAAWRIPRQTRERWIPARGLWLACAVLFLFFSASTGKRGVYLLPLFPALALLLAAGWRLDEDAPLERSGPPSSRLRALHVIVFLVLGLAAPVALPIVAARRAPDLVAGAALLGAIAAVSSIAGAVLFRRGRPDAALVAHIAGLTALVCAGSFVLVPEANQKAGVRAFGAQLAALSGPDDFLVVDQEGYEQVLFYSRLRGARRDLDETRVGYEEGALVMQTRAARRTRPDADDPARTTQDEPIDSGSRAPGGSGDRSGPPRRSSFVGELERARRRVVYPAGARVLFVVAGPRADRLRREIGPSSRTLLAAPLYGKPYFVIASR